jgi:hypothetical protein
MTNEEEETMRKEKEKEPLSNEKKREPKWRNVTKTRKRGRQGSKETAKEKDRKHKTN